MLVAFQIAENPNGFVITVKKPRSWWQTIMGAIISGVLAYYFASLYLHHGRNLDYAIARAVAILSGFLEFKPANTITTVTKFEIQVVGSYGGGYRPNRHVPLADIAAFEFREQTNKPYRPRGLYALLRWGGTCVVPHIDQTQTELVKDAIYNRFGHILNNSDAQSLHFLDDEIIKLNLNQP